MIRSLGPIHTVYIASTGKRLQSLQKLLKSKYCTNVVEVHNPETHPDVFVEDINRLVRQLNIDAFLTHSDEMATVVSHAAERLHVSSPLPSFPVFEHAIDKQKTLETAQKLGIPTPNTIVTDDSLDVKAELNRLNIEYPVILKPRRRGSKGGTLLITSQSELESKLIEFDQIGDDLPTSAYSKALIQENVPGDIHDCCVLYQNGCLKAMLTQVRHRGILGSGGVGVVNITTDIPDLKRMSKQLLDQLGWHGPAQIEWIRDARDGRYKLLEINPRFWGTLELSIDAGIDFPKLAVRMLDGEELEEHFTYSVGEKHRWAFPEELTSVFNHKGQRATRLREYLNPSDIFDPTCHFSARLSDPKPDIFRAIESLSWLCGNRFHRLRKSFHDTPL